VTDTSLLITDYASLQTAMGKWLNRSDLATMLPVFIQQCESGLRRIIKTKHKALISTTVSAGDGSVALPTDLIAVESVAISDPVRFQGELNVTTYADLLDDRRMHVVAGCPQTCAVVNEALYLSPLADGVYTLVVQVEGPFVPLSDSATTNWILDDYPDVYLYGSLMHSSPYIKDDERVALWQSFYERAKAELELAAERSQWPASPTMKVPANFLTIPQSPQR
jgi:hypothetical protein